MRALGRSASRARTAVFLVMAVLVWTSLATVASAAADKNFTATVSPEPLAAGASYGVGTRGFITLTIRNTSNRAQLGSANVTLPAGLTATAATSVPGTAALDPTIPNTIDLRNLNLQPSASAVVSVSAQVECAANHASYTWSFVAKQANDFNGTPGNNLVHTGSTASTIDGQCGLSFSKQPMSEEKNVTITNKIYDVGVPQSGDPVTVSILDRDGNAVPWWNGMITLAMGANPSNTTLGGSPLSKSTTTGSATFAPQIGVSATNYTLSATAVGTAGSPSAGTSAGAIFSSAFTIVDDATICQTKTSSCMVTASGPTHGNVVSTQATVTAGANNGTQGGANDLVILQVADPATNFSCGTYAATTDMIAFNATLPDGVTPVLRVKTTQLTLFAPFVTRSASQYDVCYRSSGLPFTPKGGGSQVTTGLLPNCAAKNSVAPCVLSRASDKAKDVIITVLSPAGDPGMKF